MYHSKEEGMIQPTMRLLLITALILVPRSLHCIVTLNNNDPAPLFSSQYPYSFLYTNYKEILKDRQCDDHCPIFSFSVSPYYQRAHEGKDSCGNQAELGDLAGKLNAIAVLPFGGIKQHTTDPLVFYNNSSDIPAEIVVPAELTAIRNELIACINDVVTFNRTSGANVATQPSTSVTDPTVPLNTVLQNTIIRGGTPVVPAQACVSAANITGIPTTSTVTQWTFPATSPLTTVEGLISLQQEEDIMGFFNIPIKYRKRGVRFQIQGKLCSDIGFTISTGVANITQCGDFNDRTLLRYCPQNCASTTPTTNPPATSTATDAVPLATNHLIQTPVVSQNTTQVTALAGPTEQFTYTPGPDACSGTGTSVSATAILTQADMAAIGNPGSSSSTTIVERPLVGDDSTCTPTPNTPDSGSGTTGTPTTASTTCIKRWEGTLQCIHNKLMNRFAELTKAIGVDLCNFDETSMEDIHGQLFWRHAFVINEDTEIPGQPAFLFIPFVSVGGSIAIAKERDQDQYFSLPFGNNGHKSASITGGFAFDFHDTIEIGATAGFTHFFSKAFCEYRVPNNEYQRSLYPYKTDVEIAPGNTWYIEAFLYGHNIIDQLSFYTGYQYVSHEKDTVHLLDKHTSTSAFTPDVLECASAWSSHLLNVSGNYAISPSFNLGGVVQVPLEQRNAYKATTFMGTFEISY